MRADRHFCLLAVFPTRFHSYCSSLLLPTCYYRSYRPTGPLVPSARTYGPRGPNGQKPRAHTKIPSPQRNRLPYSFKERRLVAPRPRFSSAFNPGKITVGFLRASVRATDIFSSHYRALHIPQTSSHSCLANFCLVLSLSFSLFSSLFWNFLL